MIVAKGNLGSLVDWARFLAETRRDAILAALVISAVMALRGLEVERKCAGFYSPFGTVFTHAQCNLEIGYVGAKTKLTIPLPDWTTSLLLRVC